MHALLNSQAEPALAPSFKILQVGDCSHDALDALIEIALAAPQIEPRGLCKLAASNVLTQNKGAVKLRQGPSAHACLVDIKLAKGTPSRATAHEPQQINRSHTHHPEMQA